MSETTTRQQRIEESRTTVDTALARLADALRQGKPEELLDYLRFARRFHRYSLLC